jgi:hypothetical protein
MQCVRKWQGRVEFSGEPLRSLPPTDLFLAFLLLNSGPGMANNFSSKLLLLLVAFSLVGCPSRSDREKEDPYREASTAIDNRDYATAIALMNSELARNPEDSKARVILASAYAARAGIHLRRFIDFSREIVSSSKDAERLLENRGLVVFEKLKSRLTERDQISAVEIFEHVYKAAWWVSNLLRRFDSIPVIKGQRSLDDLRMAVATLSTGTITEGGPSLYRGLLRLTLMRNDFKDDLRWPELKQCRLNLAQSIQRINRIHAMLRDILFDFAYGSLNKSNRKNLMSTIDQIDRYVNDAIELMRKSSRHSEIDISPIVGLIGSKDKCK